MTAYTCGLVHDIGKVRDTNWTRSTIRNFFQGLTSRVEIISFFNIELVNQSARHDYLGYLLCKNWGLSAWVESVVMWHHEPDVQRRRGVPSAEANALVDIVIAAIGLRMK